MRRISIVSLGVAVAVGSASAAVGASGMPGSLEHAPSFEVASGEVSRGGYAPIYDRAPEGAEREWQAFSARAGTGGWRAMWNPETEVPQRLFGPGMVAPDSVGSAAAAAAYADEVLADHVDLLAPGASPSDFELAANEVGPSGMRNVVYHQYHEGAPVLGGYVSFRFRNDRLFMIASQAYPNVDVPTAAASVASARARESAREWVRRDFGGGEVVAEPAGPYVLPIVRGPGEIDYHTVVSVGVEEPSVPAAWEVYVDGQSGEEIAREQRIRFGSGYVSLDVPETRPGEGRTSLPASFLEVNVEGLSRIADMIGRFTWGASGARDVSFGMRGDFVEVDAEQGGSVEFEERFSPEQEHTFGAGHDELLDAQVALYAHTNYVRNYVRQYTSNPWLENQLLVRANVDDPFLPFDTCNAFFNPGFEEGDEHLGFLASGVVIPEDEDGEPIEDEDGEPIEIECNNTGRIASIIYHEYGHAIHAHAYIPGTGIPDSPLSEGVSDYLAVTITGDPAVGRGFFADHPNPDIDEEAPIRHLDPEAIGEERRVFPDDFQGDPETIHEDGLIIGQALWALREELIAKHGEEAGIARADRIWYGILQGADDMPSAYLEALAADDEDGDLNSGTPNSCLINRVFGEAGLGFGDGVVVPGLERPELTGHELSVGVRDPAGCDPVDVGSMRVHWHYRDDPDGGGSLEMDEVSSGYEVAIPSRDDIDDGDVGEVLEYQIEVRFENGGTTFFPKNAADPYYQDYIGEVGEVYCTAFDADPFDEDLDDDDYWERDSDLTDDEVWEWGEPQSRGLGGAPTDPYLGGAVVGTDLAEYSDGLHPAGTSWIESPSVELQGLDEVRLQFRRWLAATGDTEARIYANDEIVWERAESSDRPDAGSGRPDHLEREWVFQDIDLSDYIDRDEIAIRFEFEAGEDDRAAGWAIDDLCFVVPEQACPDFEDGETCPQGGCPPGCPEPSETGADLRESGGCSAAGAGSAAGALLVFGMLAIGRRARRVLAG